MSKPVDHYMVDYTDAKGDVHFANDTHLYSLDDAKKLAATVSKEHGSACVVSFVAGKKPHTFEAVGQVPFFAGVEDTGAVDGQVA